ncbi:hypothetical protein ACFVW1_11745 [Streptomyces olivochromogenes]|uniref:hypothetical protein n=1 Tax=Streptomyces olivochromogenes TaxID=1963 RepID=UPI0036DB208B
MTAGWCSRTVRAAVFAVVCVLLAALGHVMMSGGTVPWWALGASGAVVGGAGWCLAGRERGLPLIVSAVVAAQAVLHSVFSLAQSSGSLGVWGAAASVFTGHDMNSMPTGPMSMSSMSPNSVPMDSTRMGAMDMGAMDHPGHAADGTSSSLGMLAAHLLAALLCGLWLAHGERAVFRVLRALAGLLAAPLRLPLTLPAPVSRPRPRVRRDHSTRAPRRLLLVHAITSRGPPAGTAVV